MGLRVFLIFYLFGRTPGQLRENLLKAKVPQALRVRARLDHCAIPAVSLFEWVLYV